MQEMESWSDSGISDFLQNLHHILPAIGISLCIPFIIAEVIQSSSASQKCRIVNQDTPESPSFSQGNLFIHIFGIDIKRMKIGGVNPVPSPHFDTPRKIKIVLNLSHMV